MFRFFGGVWGTIRGRIPSDSAFPDFSIKNIFFFISNNSKYIYSIFLQIILQGEKNMNEKDPRIMMLYNDAHYFHLIHNG